MLAGMTRISKIILPRRVAALKAGAIQTAARSAQ
jgi:hypothetical protein